MEDEIIYEGEKFTLYWSFNKRGRCQAKEYFDDLTDVFRPQPDRFFCFFMKGSRIYVTNAYEKKSQKMPKAQKARALRLRDERL
jgi:phage-related protein